MAWSVRTWKILPRLKAWQVGFPKASIYLERLLPKHPTNHIQTRWH